MEPRATLTLYKGGCRCPLSVTLCKGPTKGGCQCPLSVTLCKVRGEVPAVPAKVYNPPPYHLPH